jgi:hypothetical protein
MKSRCYVKGMFILVKGKRKHFPKMLRYFAVHFMGMFMLSLFLHQDTVTSVLEARNVEC